MSGFAYPANSHLRGLSCTTYTCISLWKPRSVLGRTQLCRTTTTTTTGGTTTGSARLSKFIRPNRSCRCIARLSLAFPIFVGATNVRARRAVSRYDVGRPSISRSEVTHGRRAIFVVCERARRQCNMVAWHVGGGNVKRQSGFPARSSYISRLPLRSLLYATLRSAPT